MFYLVAFSCTEGVVLPLNAYRVTETTIELADQEWKYHLAKTYEVKADKRMAWARAVDYVMACNPVPGPAKYASVNIYNTEEDMMLAWEEAIQIAFE